MSKKTVLTCDGCGLEIVHSGTGPPTQEYLILTVGTMYDPIAGMSLKHWDIIPKLPDGDLHFHGFTCLTEYVNEVHDG